ncbi:hypothetical protein CW693_00725 [Candidatus Bathyarchaeota archaeon]|nr:MAG: hypothetical protein CW693_00725 [Candidatus Bathyarchaeota archaeon]
MGLLDLFRRKKKEEKIPENTEKEPSLTELEQICQNNREVYEALYNTMFLDPRKVDVSLKEAVEKAKTFEKAKDLLRAKMWYEIAGGLAIYKGDVKKVKEYFSKCEKISGKKYPILNNAEEAVAKAQEYYKKYLVS